MSKVSFPPVGVGIERPKIDPAEVPDCDYDLACTVLFSSISMALSNPKLRSEYEAWKLARKEVTQQ